MNFTHIFPRKGGGRSSGKGGKGDGDGGGGSKGSPAARKGASSSFTKSKFSNSFKLSGTKVSAAPYSDGGGKSFTIKSGPFSGRTSGGSTRDFVYGTRTYGSGYPYGGYGYYISDRPFPYGFYPVYIQSNYYGNDEYGNVNNTDRPGGNFVAAIIQPSYNPSSVTYRILGDNASVSAVFQALVSNCSIESNTSNIFAFTPSTITNTSTWPLPEQVIQWYRASTFALSLDGYNNTAALASNQPSSNSSTDFTPLPDTSLPDGLNTTFLECVNSTVGASVPMFYKPPPVLDALDISQIVVWGSVALFFIAGITYAICRDLWKACKSCCKRATKKRGAKKKAVRYNSLEQVEQRNINANPVHRQALVFESCIAIFDLC
ncbi:hypothetical protein SCHPADRAFT_883096 [Schizopora paradoxa]|uniref:Uncharacterized protein n=1 Tax=Schizopora paradoxa TaxID=27342 RepID=A0A0H2R2W9_9AGAM|nr:hypothetical protein SCHPADRAFT_883096 [Schizopora paradoxa]